jgi:hypothetical protein
MRDKNQQSSLSTKLNPRHEHFEVDCVGDLTVLKTGSRRFAAATDGDTTRTDLHLWVHLLVRTYRVVGIPGSENVGCILNVVILVAFNYKGVQARSSIREGSRSWDQ